MKKPEIKKVKQKDKPIKILEEYYNYSYRSMVPLSESAIEKIAHELVEFSHKEDSLTFISFCRSIGITFDQLKVWRLKYPLIGKAYAYAQEQFLDKREVGGLTNKLNAVNSWNAMPFYSQDWKDFTEWKALITKKADEVDRDIKITLQDIRREVEEEKTEPVRVVIKDIADDEE